MAQKTKSVICAFLLLGSLGLVAGLVAAARPASASPVADTEMICHTKNRHECYSRIFQPTEEFQTVRDDQDLPAGLHVRLNLETGKKEARLNIPMEGGDAWEGLPVESGAIAVSQQQPEGEHRSLADIPNPQAANDEYSRVIGHLTPQEALAYDGAGKIRPPRAAEGDSGDSATFAKAVHILEWWSYGHQDLDPTEALDDLSDLSHDIFYGFELMKNRNVVSSLVQMIANSETDTKSTKNCHQAASVFGAAIQNNPKALYEANESWHSLDTRIDAPKLGEKLVDGLDRQRDPSTTRARVSALYGALKSSGIRREFLRSGGPELLLPIFLRQGKEWDSTRVKIAQLIMDIFLDENMGAELGLWPRESAQSQSYCSSGEHAHEDACWESHLKNKGLLGKEHGEDWVSEFLRLLEQGRKRVIAAKDGSAREL